MSIYRGAGGSGDATADSSSEALLIRELAVEVQADADAAAASAASASGSASSASTSATNAATSATNAASSATSASNSASAASTSASNAATSATAAQTAETAAELAETNAETAETNAAASASSASTSATTATTQATNASNSASAATTQASNASTSATNAANSATSAAASATNAANSATLAASYTPSQTGNSGKYLTTDGTNTSWDALATVANSGSYNDLSDKPTIPTNLDSLTDVTVTSPTTDQVLKYNGSSWVNGAAASSYNGFKNRIINGDMRIDQRNAGASVTTASGALVYTLDRWKAQYNQTSKYTIQRNAGSVTPPAGFTNYLGITSTSAYSVGAGDYFNIGQSIEGFNTADLAWGTAGAKTITLSFWVRSSLTGLFGGSITNTSFNRSYPFSYIISAANTWEQKSVTIPGDTTGSWPTDNNTGLNIVFGLGIGSTFSGTAGAWAGTNYNSVTGATSVVGTNAATWYITGVQLEVGASATPFDTRAYGTEFDLCRRYYEQVIMNIGTAGNSTTSVNTSMSWYPKRATPTMGQTGLMGVTLTGVGNYTQSASSVVGAFTPNGGTVTLGNFSGLTAQYSYYQNTNLNTNTITVSAEL